MLVDAINYDAKPGQTETTVLGPFYVENPPETPLGGDISEGEAGTALYCSGTIRDPEGVVLTWQDAARLARASEIVKDAADQQRQEKAAAGPRRSAANEA